MLSHEKNGLVTRMRHIKDIWKKISWLPDHDEQIDIKSHSWEDLYDNFFYNSLSHGYIHVMFYRSNEAFLPHFKHIHMSRDTLLPMETVDSSKTYANMAIRSSINTFLIIQTSIPILNTCISIKRARNVQCQTNFYLEKIFMIQMQETWWSLWCFLTWNK